MSRPKDQSVTEEYCNQVLSKLTDTQEITPGDILEIAERWCKKDYQHHRDFANKHGLVPIAVIIIALLWIDHPLLVAPGRGMKYNILRASAEILECELLQKDVAIPAYDFIHKQDVERI